MLFAVTAQFDAAARWKDAAAGLRELFGQTAATMNLDQAAYQRLLARRQDLADLIRGGRHAIGDRLQDSRTNRHVGDRACKRGDQTIGAPEKLRAARPGPARRGRVQALDR